MQLRLRCKHSHGGLIHFLLFPAFLLEIKSITASLHLRKITSSPDGAAERLHVPAGFGPQRLCRSSRRVLENDPLGLQLTAAGVSETGSVRVDLHSLDSTWTRIETGIIEVLTALFSTFLPSSEKAELARATAALQREREAHEVHKQQQKQVFREKNRATHIRAL